MYQSYGHCILSIKYRKKTTFSESKKKLKINKISESETKPELVKDIVYLLKTDSTIHNSKCLTTLRIECVYRSTNEKRTHNL